MNQEPADVSKSEERSQSLAFGTTESLAQRQRTPCFTHILGELVALSVSSCLSTCAADWTRKSLLRLMSGKADF